MKQTMWRPALALTLAGGLMLTACSRQEAPANSADAGSGSKETAKPTLKVLAQYSSLAKPETDPTAKEIEAGTGYKVQYSMLPADNPTQKLSIEVAAGADYDIVRMEPDAFRMLAKQNALLPLDDLLKQHGQDVMSALFPETWELTKIDGKIYGIPKRSERLNIEKGLAIREDLLNAAGLKTPQTLDEFYTALKTLKDKNKDMSPLTSGDIRIPTILSAFGLYNNWTDVGGTLVPFIKMPQLADYMTFMIKLYNEGLLDKDLPVNKSTTVREKFAAGKAAAMPYSWSGATDVYNATLKNNANAKIGTVLPLQGKGGEAGMAAFAKLVEVTAILKSSKHPVDAMKFMNAKLEPKSFENFALGKEGVTFKKEDGKYLPVMPALSDQRGSASWYLYGVREKDYAEMWLARLKRDDALFETYQRLNKDYDKYAKYDVSGFMPPLESFSKYDVALTKLVNDYLVQVLVGGEKLENLGKFIEKWDKEGGADMTREINEWYKNGGKASSDKLIAGYPRG